MRRYQRLLILYRQDGGDSDAGTEILDEEEEDGFDLNQSIGHHRRSVASRDYGPTPHDLHQKVLALNLPLVPGDGEGLQVGDNVLARVGQRLFVATIKNLVPDGDDGDAGAEVVYWWWPKTASGPFLEQPALHFHEFEFMLCKLTAPKISGTQRRPVTVFPCLYQADTDAVHPWLLDKYAV